MIGTGCLSICLQYLSVHNWLVNFFSERRHCTRYGGCTSAMLDISASIIQWSAVDPVSYVINTGDLATVVQGNRIHKYADDTYIIIPASNVQHREAELEHVAQWAQANNLKLNRTKSVEVIFSSRRKPQECHPPKLLNICYVTNNVTTITIPESRTLTNHLSISEHVTDIISKCAQSLYALKVLRCHARNG